MTLAISKRRAFFINTKVGQFLDSNFIRPKIIAVDDRPENLIALQALLKSSRYELVTFGTGQETLDYLRTNGAQAAMILLDAQMPIMDGFAVATAIRNDEQIRDIPILFLTALDRSPAYVERAYALGAVDYITKPIEPTVLRAKVDFFIQLFIKSRQIQAQASELRGSATRERDLLLENALDAVIGISESEEIIYWNRKAEQIFGWSKAEVLSQHMGELIVPARYREAHSKGMKRFIKSGESRILNQRIDLAAQRRDGTEFPAELTVTAIQTSSGYSFYSFLRDLTEEKAAGNALTQAVGRLEFLSDASRILSSSLDYEVTLENLTQIAVPKMADWCSVQLLDKGGVLKQISLSHRDPKSTAGKHIETKLPSVRPASGPYKVVQTGQLDWFPDLNDEILKKITSPSQRQAILEVGTKSYICVPLTFRDRILGAMSFAYTDSGRKFTQDDVRLAEEVASRVAFALENSRLYREAQNVNRLKDEFLATLSHELRTPLNVILGNAEFLEAEIRAGMDEEVASSIHAIYRNSKLQTQIINDLLDVSSIITGKIKLNPVALNPGRLAREVAESLRQAAESKGIELSIETAASDDNFIADPTRMSQILWNLLSNAVKFTPSGGRIAVRVYGADDRFSFEVRDTGIGIDPQFLPSVFEKFSQEDSKRTRIFGGLGLGLSIVRHLAETHGGSVSATSRGKNQGSTFTVLIPGQKVASSDEVKTTYYHDRELPKPKGPLLQGLSVLLVEDSPDNMVLVSRILKKSGATVMEASSARQARELLQNKEPGSDPMIIVSDIGMPEEDGLAFMRSLRASSAARLQTIPAVALTAYVRPEEVADTAKAGFQAHLPKPVVASDLIDKILSLLQK